MERSPAAHRSAKASQLVLSQTINIGSIQLRIYSFTMLAAVLVGYFIGRSRAIRAGIAEKDFDDIAFWAIVFGFLSARLYYVITYFSSYRGNLIEVFKIWHGGLSIYGALIGGAAAVYYFCRKRKINFLHFADLIVVGLPLAQAIGRFGNYFNYEAFGAPTSLPWKMFVPLQFRPTGYLSSEYFHPTFAYEAIWNIIVFLIIIGIARYYKNLTGQKPGLLFLLTIALYSFGRFWIEAIRLDSAFLWGFRIDQIIALLLILASLAIIIARYVPQARK